MNRLVNKCLVVAVATAGVSGVVQAESGQDTFSLRMSNAVAPDRFFVRAGVIAANVKTKSGDAYDVTGPALLASEVATLDSTGNNYIRDALLASGKMTSVVDAIMAAPGAPSVRPTEQTIATQVQTTLRGAQGLRLLTAQLEAAGREVTQLGTPVGIKAIAKENIGTAGLSLGMFLDDEYKWTVEAYVLAKPLTAEVMGRGPLKLLNNADDMLVPTPLAIQDQKIISTKMLPPTVVLGRYWGEKEAKFRPYTGVIGMYSIFYDTKATDLLNNFVGGSNPGDTTVSFKNTFGMGPVLGLKYQFADDWHLSFNVGSVKLKTQGTIVTRNTYFTKDTGAIAAYGRDLNDTTTDPGSISETIITAETNPSLPIRQQVKDAFGGVTGITSAAIAYLRGQTIPGASSSNLGTYVRKSDATLSSTIFMLSVGHSF